MTQLSSRGHRSYSGANL